MADFNQIDEARRLLELGDGATLKEIRSAYKRLAQRHHPDKHGGGADNTEVMKRLNWAYRLLTAYCDEYRYSFREEDIARTYPHEEYLRKHRYDWFYGP
jgi:DnaJ-class molecular chaperone